MILIRHVLALSITLSGLASCSSDGDGGSTSTTSTTTPTTGAPLTLAALNGNWSTGCVAATPSPGSFTINTTITNGSISATGTIYSDNACTMISMVPTPATSTFTLGSVVTIDGSVAGLTTATQIDITDTTAGSPDFGTIEYDIIAISSGQQLFTGNTDGVNDASTPALRPIQLDPLTFFRI